MSLISLTIPLASIERAVIALERIAECVERAFPSPYTEGDNRLQPPEPGLTIVTDRDVAEEQSRVYLRSIGYRPDEIDEQLSRELDG